MSSYDSSFGLRDAVAVRIHPQGLILVSETARRWIPWSGADAKRLDNEELLVFEGEKRLVRLAPLEGQSVAESARVIGVAALAKPASPGPGSTANTPKHGWGRVDRCSVPGCTSQGRLESCAMDQELVCYAHLTPIAGGYLCPTCASAGRRPGPSAPSPGSGSRNPVPAPTGSATSSAADILAVLAGIAMVVAVFLPWFQTHGLLQLSLTAIQFLGQEPTMSAIVVSAVVGAGASAVLVLSPETGASLHMRAIFAVACVAMLGATGFLLLAWNSPSGTTSGELARALVSPGPGLWLGGGSAIAGLLILFVGAPGRSDPL